MGFGQRCDYKKNRTQKRPQRIFQKKEIDYSLFKFRSFVFGDLLFELNAFEKAKMRLMVKSLGPVFFFGTFFEE